MDKIYILGDIHSDYHPVRDLINKVESKINTIILLGDAGLNFFFNHRDNKTKEKINKYEINIFIIRGNHEQRPSICMSRFPDAWHMEEYWGNQVYVENNYPYIKYALDIPAKYEIPTEKGTPIQTLILPGAYSVDKYYRLKKGWSWFPLEQLGEHERYIGSQLANSQNWDLILSHTCPIIYEPTDLFLTTIDQSTVDKTMERWLGEIEYQINYTLWCWGHYHSNRIYPKTNNSDRLMLFNDCCLDLYKYFCEKYNLYDCLIKIKDIQIDNLNKF